MCNRCFSCKASPSFIFKSPPHLLFSLPQVRPRPEHTKKVHQLFLSVAYHTIDAVPLTLTQLSRSSWESRHKHVDKHTPIQKRFNVQNWSASKKNLADVCLYHISSRLFKKTLQVYSTKKSTLRQSDVMDHVVGRVFAQDMMLHQNGNFSAAHHNRDTVWVCVNSMMPSQNLTLSAVTPSPLSFPSTRCQTSILSPDVFQGQG